MSCPLRILLADDDADFFKLFEICIDRLAEDVIVDRVSDGEQCVQWVNGDGDYENRAQYPFPHLILLDERMPLMDGTEALRRLKKTESGRSVPVVLMSSSSQDALVRRAYTLGASAFIVKPTAFAELRERVSQLVSFYGATVELPERTGRE